LLSRIHDDETACLGSKQTEGAADVERKVRGCKQVSGHESNNSAVLDYLASISICAVRDDRVVLSRQSDKDAETKAVQHTLCHDGKETKWFGDKINLCS
jgi:hypothetical protein